MQYLQKQNGKITCYHPSVKEVKEFGSASRNPTDGIMYYNIQVTTHDGVEYMETSDKSESAIERMEQKLQSLSIK